MHQAHLYDAQVSDSSLYAPDPAPPEPPLDGDSPPIQTGDLAERRGLFNPPSDQEVTDEPHLDRLNRLLLGTRRLALGGDRLFDWLGTFTIVAFAAVLRLINLGRPHRLVFDETFYVKDGFSLWRLGFEAQWPDGVNALFEAGNVTSYIDQAAYVVHPQVGKWLIGLGIHLGGGAESAAAWRLANAVIGILAVLLIIRIARRLFASVPMALLAGTLMAVDGTAIVHSRIALLDQHLMFFVLLAFWFLILDREQARRRLAVQVAAELDAGSTLSDFGPNLGMRWWRLAAGVSLGLATGVKWSGLYFIAVFGLMTVLWDVTARRRAGIKRWLAGGVLEDGLLAFLMLVPVALLTYVASWFSWFTTPGAWGRGWAAQNPGQGITWLPEGLRSFVRYHEQMWGFHTGLDATHAYAAHPLGWIVQWRPTAFYWERVDENVAVINSIGNPLLWWLAALAIVAVTVLGITRRDWRALAVVSGTIAGWVPWLAQSVLNPRTVFTFYTIVFTPWVILTLVYVAAVALEHTSEESKARARQWVWTTIGVVLGLILVVSGLFYPLWTAMEVSFPYWRRMMWLGSWI